MECSRAQKRGMEGLRQGCKLLTVIGFYGFTDTRSFCDTNQFFRRSAVPAMLHRVGRRPFANVIWPFRLWHVPFSDAPSGKARTIDQMHTCIQGNVSDIVIWDTCTIKPHFTKELLLNPSSPLLLLYLLAQSLLSIILISCTISKMVDGFLFFFPQKLHVAEASSPRSRMRLPGYYSNFRMTCFGPINDWMTESQTCHKTIGISM